MIDGTRTHRIVVTAASEVYELEIERAEGLSHAESVKLAKEAALVHMRRLGYEDVKLEFPKRKRH